MTIQELKYHLTVGTWVGLLNLNSNHPHFLREVVEISENSVILVNPSGTESYEENLDTVLYKFNINLYKLYSA